MNRFSGNLYRLLLYAYPKEFRKDYGQEMTQAFGESLEFHRKKRGRIGTSYALCASLIDGLKTAAEEHRRRPGHAPNARNQRSRRENLMNTLVQDLRYAFRTFGRHPGFTAVAVLSLALGIGANTAVFSLVEATLLDTLPVREPDRLVLFNWDATDEFSTGSHNGWMDRIAGGLRTTTSLPYPTFRDFRDQTVTLDEVFAFFSVGQGVSMGGAGLDAELVGAQLVTGNYYSALGVGAAVGRTIEPADDVAGATPVAMISYGYWQRRFGGDSAVVGRPVDLNGQPVTLIGVTAAGFDGTLQVGTSPDISIPMALAGLVSRGGAALLENTDSWWLQVMGRLKPEIDPEGATDELDLIFRNSIAAGRGLEPEDPTLPSLRLTSGSRGLNEIRSRLAEPLLVTLGVVGLVLLIASVNVAVLLLARAESRQKEIAIRFSIGAGRGRVVRQLVTESVALAGVGGLLGLIFTFWARNLLPSLISQYTPFTIQINPEVNATVLAFSLGVSLISGVLFGLAPALRATGFTLNSGLKEQADWAGSKLWVGRSLVTAQVALSVVALVIAGLFLGTLENLRGVDIGTLNPANLVLFKLNPSLTGYTTDQQIEFFAQLQDRIQTIPGIEAATMSRATPLGRGGSRINITIPGQADPLQLDFNYVGTNYFEIMEIDLVAGRRFTRADSLNAPQVGIINQALARKHFNDQNPIGAYFDFGGGPNPISVQIVGVVSDVNFREIRYDVAPSVFLPFTQSLFGLGAMTVAVRTRDADSGISDLRRVVTEMDATLPIFSVTNLEEQIDSATAQERQFAILSSIAGVVALLLASIGLYGILSQSVMRRTREFGIRAALGAPRSSLVGLVMREIYLVIGGAALGLLVAAGTTRLLSSMLFGLSPLDLPTYAVSALLLVGVAAVAAYLPARRAGRVDPVIALRSE